MAYYTVAHILQGGQVKDGSYIPNFNGESPSPFNIKPEQMNDQVWDFIMLNGPKPDKCTIAPEILQKMRNEFNYWYVSKHGGLNNKLYIPWF